MSPSDTSAESSNASSATLPQASPPASNSGAHMVGPNPGPGHPSFRRQRAARACETCHARKVRCDAASLGVPCTNCVAFSIECKIPMPKRKKLAGSAPSSASPSTTDNATGRMLDGNGYTMSSTRAPAPADIFVGWENGEARRTSISASPVDGVFVGNRTPQTTVAPGQDGTPNASYPDAKFAQVAADSGTYTQFMRPKFARQPIKEAGRVAYLGESSNLSLLVQDKHGSTDVVHYPLPENVRGTRARLTELDTIEIDILHQRGAFLLPPRALCDELVGAFFRWVAPVVPVVNRSRFMQRYRDPKNPPSLLLLQSILLAGSRVCDNPQLKDSSGSTTPAAMTFYKRAKALYDANYEDDRVTIVQSLVLMGWYWEGPEDVTKNVFYWSRVATIVAQGSGMHRSVEHSQLSQADKRLWKRIWWTLFTRDRSVAVALGRPVHINTDDSDVEMVTEEDFNEDEEGSVAEFPPDALHVQFFLQHVKLCEIMGLVLAQQYSVASKARRQHAIDLVHSDLALADWMLHVPPEMRYHVEDKSRQNFWAALLHSTYYTTLCLLHRAHMPPAMTGGHGGDITTTNSAIDDSSYPSRNIAFRAAHAITSIVENLVEHDELKYCPAFIVYSLFSALIMHVYQMRSSIPGVVAETKERMRKCMDALRDVSRIWIVAKMVYTLFESILGNKALEERLQKSAGRRHHHHHSSSSRRANNTHQHSHQHRVPLDLSAPTAEPPKRKFDDMDLSGGALSGPVPTMSYERSRPQTPATTPGGAPPPPLSGLPGSSGGGGGPGATTPSTNSTSNPHASPYPPVLGGSSSNGNGALPPPSSGLNSRGATRPPTPFNGAGPTMSVPATPPDLYLVTRSSPPISQSLWENFQPNQLFPDDSGLAYLSPPAGPGGGGGGEGGGGFPPPFSDYGGVSGSSPTQRHAAVVGVGAGGQPWPNQFEINDAAAGMGSSPDDTWSNSSKGGIVPTTLNVEDWFNFFGLHGELAPGSA